jgi:DNA-binding PadR family transcriptional regulator
MELNTLSALLLFLAEHRSGYDIRLLFKATPLGVFSDSPGAIYPALARLEARGLLASEAEAGGRRRRAYFRTPAGEAALDAWLRAPVDHEITVRRPHEHELRYVIVAYRLGRAAGAAFLAACADSLRTRIAELEAFAAGHPEIGAVGVEALDLGIQLFRTRLNWCVDIAKKGGE